VNGDLPHYNAVRVLSAVDGHREIGVAARAEVGTLVHYALHDLCSTVPNTTASEPTWRTAKGQMVHGG
jgi:hypothetical protein